MAYCTNPALEYLLRHSYGQGGTVSVPARDATTPLAPPMHVKGRFPAGVQDVLDRLVEVYAGWTPSNSDRPLEWCFLVGGPGNGKSEALRDLAGALQVELPLRSSRQPVPRTVPTSWPTSPSTDSTATSLAFSITPSA